MKKPQEPKNICGLKENELRFLRAKDVSQILCISRQQLHRIRKAGSFIKPIRVSKNVVAFRSDELLDWMNHCELVNENVGPEV